MTELSGRFWPIGAGMKKSVGLLALLVFIESAFAESKLLICEGESVQWFNPQYTEPLKDQITIEIDLSAKRIESSVGGVSEIAQYSGQLVVWTGRLGDMYTLVNLNIVSGRLEKLVSKTPVKGGSIVTYKSVYTCRRVKGTLLD